MVKLLSSNDVLKILTIKDTINILESAFTELAKGKADMPERSYIASQEYNGMTLIMPGCLKDSNVLGSKIVSVYKNNLNKYNLPNVIGTIILLDPKTGQPISIMDGTQITAFRTGAVAGLAAKYLSRKNSKIHTIFGTGGMSESHVIAISEVRNIEKLNIVSTSSNDQKQKFAESLKMKINCEINISENHEGAVKESDIISLITNAKEPVINYNWITPGSFISGAGSHSPTTREIDTDTIINAKCVCDSIEACKIESGDFIIPIQENKWTWDKLHGTLGQVCANEIKARENNDEIIVFKSVGLAIQDLSTANYVYNKAMEMGIGVEFSF